LSPIGACYTLEWAWNGCQTGADSELSDEDIPKGQKRHSYPPKYKRFLHVWETCTYFKNPLFLMNDNQPMNDVDESIICSGERLRMNMKHESKQYQYQVNYQQANYHH
jgi:hypothetical protein